MSMVVSLKLNENKETAKYILFHLDNQNSWVAIAQLVMFCTHIQCWCSYVDLLCKSGKLARRSSSLAEANPSSCRHEKPIKKELCARIYPARVYSGGSCFILPASTLTSLTPAKMFTRLCVYAHCAYIICWSDTYHVSDSSLPPPLSHCGWLKLRAKFNTYDLSVSILIAQDLSISTFELVSSYSDDKLMQGNQRKLALLRQRNQDCFEAGLVIYPKWMHFFNL